MKTAIFGAFGTIGRSVASALLARGDSVRALGRSEAKLREAFGGAPEVVDRGVPALGTRAAVRAPGTPGDAGGLLGRGRARGRAGEAAGGVPRRGDC